MQEKQKRTHVHSATFWHIFTLYAVPALLLIVGTILLLYGRSAAQRRQETHQRSLETVETVTLTLENLLSERIMQAETLHGTYWIQKQFLQEGTLAELGPMEKIYQTELTLLYCNAYTLERAVFLYFPVRDVCVSLHTWARTQDYLSMLKIDGADQAAFVEKVSGSRIMHLVNPPEGSTLKGTLLLCLPLENVRAPRGFVVFALDRKRLENLVSAQMPEAVRALRVVDADGQEILAVGGAGRRMETVERTSDYMPWRYVFSIDPSLYTVAGTRARPDILLYVSVLLLALGVFYLVALRVYAPIGRLATDVAGVSRQNRRDDYQAISQSFERLSARVADERRFSALQSLLLGCFEGAEDTLERSSVPFPEDKWYQVLLVRGAGEESLRWLEKALEIVGRHEAVRCERVAQQENGILILCYPDEASGRELGAGIRAELSQAGVQVVSGRLRPGRIGISISYQDCAAGPMSDTAVRYYFPLEWENQLIGALRTGNLDTALRIVDALRRENAHRLEKGAMQEKDLLSAQRVILSDLQRVGLECGMTPEQLGVEAADGDAWARIGEGAARLCQRTGKTHPGEEPLGARMTAYVEAHCQEPDLSLSILEDWFHVSSSTVNKCFKEETGVTFLVYLTRLRIQRAKKLLGEGRSIAETASLCGYENEYSFRRVFHRTVGVRAQDYRGEGSGEE